MQKVTYVKKKFSICANNDLFLENYYNSQVRIEYWVDREPSGKIEL